VRPVCMPTPARPCLDAARVRIERRAPSGKRKYRLRLRLQLISSGVSCSFDNGAVRSSHAASQAVSPRARAPGRRGPFDPHADGIEAGSLNEQAANYATQSQISRSTRVRELITFLGASGASWLAFREGSRAGAAWDAAVGSARLAR
jgi:hypothetical protein